MSHPPGEFKPSRRDVLRPIEYVGGAAIAAIFVGTIALIVTRDIPLAIISTGAVFIIVLVSLALLAMTVKPDSPESPESSGDTGPGDETERGDEPERPHGH